MSDISKCNGTDCPLRENCWRFRAPADKHYQAYVATFFSDILQNCPYYWDMDMEERKLKGETK
jgi:hypothetical protein